MEDNEKLGITEEASSRSPKNQKLTEGGGDRHRAVDSVEHGGKLEHDGQNNNEWGWTHGLMESNGTRRRYRMTKKNINFVF